MLRAPWRTPEYQARGGGWWGKCRWVVFGAGILSGIAALTGAGFMMRYKYLANQFDLSELGKMPERTIVYDANGEMMGRLHGMNRIVIPLEETSRDFIEALLAREDNRFFDHRGVDYKGVARAIVRNVKDGEFVQGASTISMQLARNSYGLTQRTMHRKLVETMLTKRIEKTVSKNRILELYVNRIFFGSGLYGIERASQAYFGIPSQDMNLGQAAMLAGIIRSPNRFSPFRNIEGAMNERDTVLGRMVLLGRLTQQEADAAKVMPLNVQEEPQWQEDYAMDFVRRTLDEWLSQTDYIEDGGLRVHTTIDHRVQRAAEAALRKHLDTLEASPNYRHPTYAEFVSQWQPGSESRTPYLQGCLVVMDNQTGGVVALVGGRDYDHSKFNRALHARRQVGSVFKPFVYASAYEQSRVAPNVLIDDNRISPAELTHYEIQRWNPRNSDGTYRGLQNAQFGLEKSRNTMTIRVGEIAGLENILKLAHRANISSDAPTSPVSFIGAFESPLLQVTNAYVTFANHGVFPQRQLIREMQDRGGVIVRPVVSGLRQQLIKPGAASWVADGLEQVMKRGTGASAKRLGWEHPAIGKTGTTDDYRDGWFIGSSSRLTCGVWVGMDNNQPVMDGGYGSKMALPIWVEVMKAALEAGYEAEAFEHQTERVPVSLCRVTGDLATEACQAAGHAYEEAVPEDLIEGRHFCEHRHAHYWQRQTRPNYSQQRPPARQPPPAPRRSAWDRFFGFFR